MNNLQLVSYHRDPDTRPIMGMIRADVEVVRQQFPFLLTLTMEYSAGPKGLPANVSEHDRISKTEVKLELAVRPGAAFLGHVTGNGRTVLLFASKTAQMAPVTVKTRLFKREAFTLSAPCVNAWEWYESGLAPTEVELAISRYFRLYTQLREHGDQHNVPRPVDFAANFPTDSGREAFLGEVFAQGYVLGKQGKWDPAPGEFWCEFVKETAIEPSRMGLLVLELEALAAGHGGEFDGWACPVVN
ncbi:MAG: ribonuclease E inhibitor RraB [Fimbriimonas sp.]|nr:ribonuclease E inhibitor RraB [Fimbriimonas sp.]